MKKIIIALSVIFGELYSLSAQSTDFLLLEVLKARTFAEHWDTIPGTDNDKQFAMCKPREWIRIADLVEIKWQKSSWGFWVPNKFSSEHWIKYDATSKQFLPKKSEQKFFGLAKCERVLVFTAIIIFIFAIIIFIFAVFYVIVNMLDCVNYHKWKEKRAEQKEAKRKAKAEQKEEMAKRHSGC